MPNRVRRTAGRRAAVLRAKVLPGSGWPLRRLRRRRGLRQRAARRGRVPAPACWTSRALSLSLQSVALLRRAAVRVRRRAGALGRLDLPLPLLEKEIRRERGRAARSGPPAPFREAVVTEREAGALQANPRWRDPGSNRGHHDFQTDAPNTRTGPEAPANRSVLGSRSSAAGVAQLARGCSAD